MRTFSIVAAIAATLAVAGATSAAAGGPTGDGPGQVVGADRADRIPGQYIVVLEDDVAVSSLVTAQARTFGLEAGNVYRSALNGYSAQMTEAAAERLAAAPGVQSVQADTEVRSTAQRLPTGINRANADASPTAAIDGTDQRVDVDVAVIDTGVDLDHPDLNVYRPGATNCSLLGLNPDDQHGHGSHVAGTIGALDNGDGVVGIAPGARIWPVKVLNAAGIGSTADVICGIDYVTANADQIEVANMSLGGSGSDDGDCGNTNGDAEHQAICASVAAGVTYVVAAGNDSADAAESSPAAYDEVITVSALADFNGTPGGGAASTCRADVDDTFADFSNFGADIDLIAPGVCIDSTWMNGGYNTISGTSMASPHVAGGAALYKATHPTASPSAVKAALQSAGSLDWNDGDDPDNTKERLLDVTGF
ncbi:MAG: S8 family serine peptidase [Propionibacteriales bacterium]|nr:S8 family serine peptidase [Propionibacteriales bacterium]